MPDRAIRIDDRSVTIHEAGAADGPAILVHHGTPLAGPPFGRWAQDAQARGARLICLDRPGYGDSTPVAGRTVADVAADSAAVMDALGVERFFTWGVSGGGPHALACAALLGDRVLAAASLAGVPPFDAEGLNYFRGMGHDNWVEFGLSLAGRDHLGPFLEQTATEMGSVGAEELGETLATLVSEPDRRALSESGFDKYWAAAHEVTFRQGATGWIDDDLAFVAPFGYELGAISVPTLIVHGEHDLFVPQAHGRWLARAVPGAEAWLSSEDGHVTLVTDRVSDVHGWLLDRA